MMRNMSFSKTTRQFQDRTKTVTRRFGWEFLNPGEVVCGVEKGMGLKSGEKVVRMGLIEVVSVRRERVDAITQDDVVREGFPDMPVARFVYDILLKGTKKKPSDFCTRIEFKHLDEEPRQ